MELNLKTAFQPNRTLSRGEKNAEMTRVSHMLQVDLEDLLREPAVSSQHRISSEQIFIHLAFWNIVALFVETYPYVPSKFSVSSTLHN